MTSRRAIEAIGRTPLLDLQKLRPEGGARILAKWEGANPTGSMKDRMALAMIQGATREGRLSPGQRVVEYTGGSTGSSLAFVCAALGHPLSIVTADCFSEEKIRTMRALGAEVEVLKTPEGKVYAGLGARLMERAREIQKETGAYWTNQVHNPHQTEGYAGMAREILAECPGVTDFVMAVGGGGCVTGNARTFREAGVAVRTTLVEPAEAPYISADSTAGTHRVEGIAVFPRSRLPLLRDDLIDAIVGVPEEEGRAMARRLAREEGLLAGTSSGLNLVASVRIARERPPQANVVTVLVDTGLKYLTGDLYG
ncbi:MAG TPA: cysteine synthase family protein [Vicinamibacteria bacterium]|nr:cysteine synthase family protein [Vicinamibacteria bacterium]